MDCRLIHWDVLHPKCLDQFNMHQLHSMSFEASQYMINPPFMHHLAKNFTGLLIACALENGFVVVFDNDAKNLKERCCFKAHEQGISQLHFIGEHIMVTSGNDFKVKLWDLSNAVHEKIKKNVHVCDTITEECQNEVSSSACHKMTLSHSLKVNWLAPFKKDGRWFIVIADCSCDLKIL